MSKSQTALLIGIDPGKSGGIAWREFRSLGPHATSPARARKMPGTRLDLLKLLLKITNNREYSHAPVIVYLEKAHAMPAQGSRSIFTYGQGFGQIEMAVTAIGGTIIELAPSKWLKGLGLITPTTKKNTKKKKKKAGRRTASSVRREKLEEDRDRAEHKRKNKNRNKQLAQDLYPHIPVTLALCDALLILEYARRQEVPT